ncbi:hypothetical protein CFR75_08515 [Komagataeibacter xylinus]|uniref:Uncharacterized protein n=2 Tax=Komagataeibacter xylinus TaxID=28448 RepID=A0A318PTE7_KOMXY|nr:hypothetical protein CFR75_08515 [Komagataeibacter xylinus]
MINGGLKRPVTRSVTVPKHSSPWEYRLSVMDPANPMMEAPTTTGTHGGIRLSGVFFIKTAILSVMRFAPTMFSYIAALLSLIFNRSFPGRCVTL